jgi:hypothetical protein
VPLLFSLLAVSVLATAVVLALPPLLLGSRLPREPGVRTFLLYFVCLGAGYILIQVALIQKFVLFLGHPTYALTVIVFSMLLASGCGSWFSRRFVQGSDSRLRAVLLFAAALLAGLAAATPAVAASGAGLPLWSKIVIAAALIAPAAFVMGIPFPAGLTRLDRMHPGSVRWAWSLNAASSVLGSAAAIFLAIYLGLRATMAAGACMYLLALLPLRKQAAPIPVSSSETSSASDLLPASAAVPGTHPRQAQ